jgi:hypothetical protein
MSLVMAFIGRHGAVMGGDTREMITCGDRVATETLEDEIYHGGITSDDSLRLRAKELGISLVINDEKRKVTQRDGVLVGEVSETAAGVTRKRRLYATAGEYAMAEVSGDTLRLTGQGNGGSFIVLGSPVTQQIAQSCIREKGKNCTLHDAIKIIILSLERSSKMSASVSGTYDLIQTPEKVSLSRIIGRDMSECRQKSCGHVSRIAGDDDLRN